MMEPRPALAPSLCRRLALFLLLLIIVLAACLRLHNLIPVERGLKALQDYDEAVWDSTAQLMLQGYLPYRDFFATLPPLGIYLLAAVLRVVYVPWGSGLGLMATRYASVAYGLATVALVYCIGCRLAGRTAGLAASGVLAVDGMVIGTDRMAMLEAPLNLFSCLAVLVYLFVYDSREDSRTAPLAVAAGVLAALAALAKTPGMVVILALLTTSVLRRRWREALWMVAGFALAWLAVCGYFVVRCPGSFLKQVYFFQFLRPPDGVMRRLTRLYDVWHYGQAWLTVRLSTVGGVLACVLVWKNKAARRWFVALAWAGFSLLLIMANSSYYPQYYVQWAVPLSLLCGALFDRRAWACIWPRVTQGRDLHWPVGAALGAGVLLFGLLSGEALRQPAGIWDLLAHSDPTYYNVADYLRRNSAPEARVLAFEPNYAFLASRPLAGARPGGFLVDSYGEMLYVNLGIEQRPLLDLMKAMLVGKKDGLQPTFWGRTAQEQTLSAFEQADYVVVDGRARYQLEPQTLAAIQARSADVFAAGVATLRRRQ